ncbi:DUF721 domain-containing protein [bacterium]|jgi:hypothetical protein|nr:DUF721 domain-containing protein [bacterium]
MDNVFKVLAKRRGFGDFVKTIQSSQHIKLVWKDVFKSLSNELHFGYFKSGTLGIIVKNPVWVTEIDYYRAEFITKLNKLAFKGKKIVYTIKIGVDSEFEFEIQNNNNSVDSTVNNNKIPLNFEDKINYMATKRRDNGEILCTTCEVVWTQSGGQCIFCRNQTPGI